MVLCCGWTLQAVCCVALQHEGLVQPWLVGSAWAISLCGVTLPWAHLCAAGHSFQCHRRSRLAPYHILNEAGALPASCLTGGCSAWVEAYLSCPFFQMPCLPCCSLVLCVGSYSEQFIPLFITARVFCLLKTISDSSICPPLLTLQKPALLNVPHPDGFIAPWSVLTMPPWPLSRWFTSWEIPELMQSFG